MSLEAVRTGLTGLIFGAATVMLALSALSVNASPPKPDYVCTMPPAPAEPERELEPEPSIQFARPPSGLPWACDQYIASVRALAQCPAFPASSYRALDEAVRQSVQAWQNLPAEALPALTSACVQARDAVTQATAQLCSTASQR